MIDNQDTGGALNSDTGSLSDTGIPVDIDDQTIQIPTTHKIQKTLKTLRTLNPHQTLMATALPQKTVIVMTMTPTFIQR